MILGKILRDLREKHNYTQRELAKALNITPASVNMKQGEARLPQIC